MSPSTIIELLANAAEAHPDRIIYSFASGDGRILERLTLQELYTGAIAIAAGLQSLAEPGDRVLIICNPGLQSVIAFWSCIYAGLIAVPVPPPARKSCDPRLQAIADDSGARIAMGALERQVQALPNTLCGPMKNIDIPGMSHSLNQSGQKPALNRQSLALLQYTSGSTGTPKGVMVNHDNLLSNAAHMHRSFELTESDHSLLWLPLFHDMGLMGGVIQPVYSGFPTIFMAPSSFISRPLDWLELISRHRITVSGGPNFAYELCARIEGGDQPLDLSSWRIAFNGSEAVRAETLGKFIDRFTPHGFRASALRPCYGLAESTLLVSVGNGDRPVLPVNAELLKRGEVEVAPEGGEAKCLVGVGSPGTGHSVLIVDPEQQECCAEKRIGEIWVAGPNVAQGYWGREEDTESLFRAKIGPDDDRAYLRTGDLGFFYQGELFITGRLKDLIIIRGHNYYPQDIEATVESNQALRRGCGAAFAVDVHGEERLVVVQELTRQGLKGDHAKILSAIRKRVFEEHQLNPYSVVLIRTGTLLKTTSGKIQRRACRDAYCEGRLDIIAKDELDMKDLLAADSGGASPVGGAAFRAWEAIDRLITQFTGIKFSDLSPDMPVNAIGMDSLTALELKIALEQVTETEIPLARILGETTIADLRRWIDSGLKHAHQDLLSYVPSDKIEANEFPLSAGQRALWFLQQLEPTNTSLTIARLLRIRGPLDCAVLRQTFKLIGERHPMLQMRVRIHEGEPRQDITGTAEISFEEHDARAWDETRLAQHVHEEAKVPFDLTQGPVLRIRCYICSGLEARLLLCAHHIAVDLRSLTVITQEVMSIYQALKAGAAPQFAPPSGSYSDYVQWQASLLDGGRGSKLWRYWHDRLNNPPPALDLSFEKNKPGSGQAQIHRFSLSREQVRVLKELGKQNKATLHAVLLGAFELLLSRYSSQNEFLLGVLSTGRTHWAWKDTVGYFVNPVVLRPRIDGNSSFVGHLRQSREQLLDAMDHSDFPFPTLVEKLHPGRSGRKAPLVQVMCMLQPSVSVAGESDLTSLVMGSAGSSFRVGDLLFESMDSDFDGAQFDLVFAAAESGDRIQAAFHYDSASFTPESISGLVSDYCALLENIAAQPQTPLAWVPMLNSKREQEAVGKWNGTVEENIAEACIHELVQQQVDRTPHHTALIFESAQLSYAELNVLANQLAYRLMDAGIGPEDRVGIYLGRSPQMVIALLAILKAGGAYVPLDPDYPTERITGVLESASVSLVITTKLLSRRIEMKQQPRFIDIDDIQNLEKAPKVNMRSRVTPDNLAYVMHTSGSTGRPKGVMISHRNVVNFFHGMDEKIGCGPEDTLVAVTSLAFDISVLELLWTLSRGCRVVLVKEQALSTAAKRQETASSALQRLRFSLFYFASSDSNPAEERYELLLEGAKLADRLGFEAVWTPERHFHPFGGLYPNPSVTSAALATITSRIRLRAGSVVLPLQNPIRVTEEWSLVDNLSQGRVGIAFASGWHADDFVFSPEHYESRRRVMLDGIDIVRRLWRGEKVSAVGGSGNTIEVGTYPRPKQAELPVWVTSGGSPETFITAAEIRANVLTHLLGQDINDVAERVNLYRRSIETNGGEPSLSAVTLMLHAYLDETEDRVREKALGPFKQYLNSSFGLVANLIRSLGLGLDVSKMTEKDKEDLLAYAAERYLRNSGLFGTQESCLGLLETLAQIGVDEVACLVDFGIDTKSALRSIERIDELRRRLQRYYEDSSDYSVAAQAARYEATMMQCTPSLLRIMNHGPRVKEAIGSMRALMLGGEAVPAALVQEFGQTGVKNVFNMYGPTETTIWSACLRLHPQENAVFIGGALTNTQIYIVNTDLMPVPNGVAGEVCIAGSGLARGYFGDPALTAERFLPDPFASGTGKRLYRTGDLGRRRSDGRIELLGRSDQQVKIRGHRIELGDIETSLNLAPGVRTGVALKITGEEGDERLIAFIVPAEDASVDIAQVRDFLKSRLPQYMVPSAFHVISTVPLTANGKIDRKALRAPAAQQSYKELPSGMLPPTDMETRIAEIWKEVLHTEVVSIDDNFFDVGGHSLLMVQVHHKVQQLLGCDFPLVAMLEHPTVRAMARYLERADIEQEKPGRDRALEQKNAFLLQRERALAAREQGR